MKVNLVKARKIEQKLSNKIKDINPPNRYRISFLTSQLQSKEEINSQLNKERVKIENIFEELREAIRVRMVIRTLIAIANVDSGIATILSEINSLELFVSRAKQISSCIQYGNNSVDSIYNEIAREILVMKEAPDKAATTVNVLILNEDSMNRFNKLIESIKSEIVALQYELAEKNYTSYIEFDDNTVRYLEKEKLI